MDESIEVKHRHRHIDSADISFAQNFTRSLYCKYVVILSHQGYGTSEIQFGHALKKHERTSFILQSKAAPKADPQAFREGLELSFEKLQVGSVLSPIVPCRS